MSTRLVEHHRTAALVVASAGPLFVNAWIATPSGADMLALERLQREQIERASGQCINLALLRPPAILAMPPAHVRETTERLLRELGPHILANAQVIEASGFTGAALRALLTSVGVLGRPPHPTRVFSTAEEGLAWLGKTTVPGRALAGARDSLAAAIEVLVKAAPVAAAH